MSKYGELVDWWFAPLSHGQVVLVAWWRSLGLHDTVMNSFNDRELAAFLDSQPAPPDWFQNWLKYLRREGVPFGKNEQGLGSGTHVRYDIIEIMEVCLAVQYLFRGMSCRVIANLFNDLRPRLHKALHECEFATDQMQHKNITTNARIFMDGSGSGRFWKHEWVENELMVFNDIYLGLSFKIIGNSEGWSYRQKDDSELLILPPYEMLKEIHKYSRYGDRIVEVISITAMMKEIKKLSRFAPEIKRGRSKS